jgi:hypothetical protein
VLTSRVALWALGTVRPLRNTAVASAAALSARPASSPVTRAIARVLSARVGFPRMRSLAAISPDPPRRCPPATAVPVAPPAHAAVSGPWSGQE